MTDVFSRQRRSWVMGRIRSKNTTPEVAVRRIIHGKGFRFRLHQRSLPGTPDIVLPRLHSIVFVNGCFWHMHPGCKRATFPKSNVAFWRLKLRRNVQKQKEDILALRRSGWKVHVIWECQVKDKDVLSRRLDRFLDKPSRVSP